MLTEYAGPWNPMPRVGLSLVPSLSRVPPAVLIVEDEALVRALGVGLFADAGFRPIEAADSDEALEILGANAEVQLLFTDVNLPGSIDGLALARQVCDRWPHIGIIFRFRTFGAATPRVPGRLPLPPQALDSDLVVSHARELTAAKRSSSFPQPAASLQTWRKCTDTVVPWGPLGTATRASSCWANALTMLVPSPPFARAKSLDGFPTPLSAIESRQFVPATS